MAWKKRLALIRIFAARVGIGKGISEIELYSPKDFLLLPVKVCCILGPALHSFRKEIDPHFKEVLCMGMDIGLIPTDDLRAGMVKQVKVLVLPVKSFERVEGLVELFQKLIICSIKNARRRQSF